MVRIAVTGGIACGKSLVGSFLADAGIAVCEADALAHALMEPGMPAFGEIVRTFGRNILGADGSIDRHLLANRVFSDLRELAGLNAIVHPEVKKSWEKWLAERKTESEENRTSESRTPKYRAAAVIIPLLYETDGAEDWDTVVCVSASEEMQMRRLGDRGILEPEARKRIAAQMAVCDKASLADYVIVNEGTKELLREQTMKIRQSILEK